MTQIPHEIEDRAHTLLNICRFGGQVKKRYSVLHHSVIGAIALMGMPDTTDDEIRGFILHDFHESQFGDIIRPVSKKYIGTNYRADVREWDDRFVESLGLSPALTIRSPRVLSMDDAILSAEIRHLSKFGNDSDYPFDDNDPMHRAAEKTLQTFILPNVSSDDDLFKLFRTIWDGWFS